MPPRRPRRWTDTETPEDVTRQIGAIFRNLWALSAQVDDDDYEWLSQYNWYAYYDPQRGMTYAAHDMPSGRRVFMHDVIMGVDTLEDNVN